MLARFALCVDAGDGVVTADEFTVWAKEQAVRVQHLERRVEGALSELSEQVEKSVDQDALSERWAASPAPSLEL